MTVEWIEGFTWIADATSGTTLETLLNERYELTDMDGGTIDSEIESAVPGPGHALKCGNDGGEGDWIIIKTPSNPQSVYISAKVWFNDIAPAGGTVGLIQLRSNASNLEILDLQLGSNGEWTSNRLSSTNVMRAATPEIVQPHGEWVTIELYCKVDNSAGEWEIKINGLSIGSETGVDTLPSTASAHVDDIVFRSNSNAVGPLWRDIIIYNGDGSVNNSWVGQQKHVYTLFPDGDSTPENWTLSAGADSWALIDDVNHDGNTTYIESATATDVTLVTLGATGSETGITAVSVHTTAALDAAGSETFDDVVKEGATTTNSAAHTVDSTTYSQFETLYDTNPDTAAPWTSSELDGTIIGVEKN